MFELKTEKIINYKYKGQKEEDQEIQNRQEILKKIEMVNCKNQE